jgi:2-phospho-L-lactate guanylyltransferase
MVKWTVLVPVKDLGSAKSRLRGALPGVPHPELVLALVRDTLSAALACPATAAVLVVTPDATVAATARAAGAGVIPDAPAAGLNAALAYGAAAAGPVPLAALTGDLPALRPDQLAAALAAATTRGYVADTAGTGTTLLAAPPGVPLDPRFGPGSARAHARSGAVALPAGASLRQDVDTAADLAAAADLGLGRHTGLRLGAMQGTVATFDETSCAGTVLLDDGTQVEFPGRAFAASGLRLLRIGQRVQLSRAPDGSIETLALITMLIGRPGPVNT